MSLSEVGAATTVKFHVSLHAADLARSIDFFRVLFGREPATSRADYAKFELDEPPLVLSFVPGPHAPGGALDHVGLRLADAAALVQVQARLESAGWQTQREEGVDCCHSRQTKFWIADPDGVVWEIYFLHDGDAEDDSHDDAPRPLDRSHAATLNAVAAPRGSEDEKRPIASWQYFLAQPLPPRIEHADDSLDQVELEGTFNLKLEQDALASFLTEVFRVLRPGGQVLVHGLIADAEIAGPLPTLPGPAAVVEHVPQVADVDHALAAAGFAGIEFTKLGERPAFVAVGVDMREMRARAVKPLSAATADCQQVVMYRGPLATVVDEQGTVYRRGERVLVSNQMAEALRAGAAAEQFAFLASRAKSNCCG